MTPVYGVYRVPLVFDSIQEAEGRLFPQPAFSFFSSCYGISFPHPHQTWQAVDLHTAVDIATGFAPMKARGYSARKRCRITGESR